MDIDNLEKLMDEMFRHLIRGKNVNRSKYSNTFTITGSFDDDEGNSDEANDNDEENDRKKYTFKDFNILYHYIDFQNKIYLNFNNVPSDYIVEKVLIDSQNSQKMKILIKTNKCIIEDYIVLNIDYPLSLSTYKLETQGNSRLLILHVN